MIAQGREKKMNISFSLMTALFTDNALRYGIEKAKRKRRRINRLACF
jgi:hypothetical protein